MSDAREVAIRLAVLKALKDEVTDLYDKTRAEAIGSLDIGDRKSAVLPDGRDIGTVTIVRGRVTAKVNDPEALLDWVRSDHPTEIESVERIRQAFMGEIIGRAEPRGDFAIWPKTGEIIPGLIFTQPDPYASTKQTSDQHASLVGAWRDGHIRIPGLLGAQPDPLEIEAQP